jgi:hypothetical protein
VKQFQITIIYNDAAECYCATARGCQGLWTRDLSQALESLLNSLLARGIFYDGENKEIPKDVVGGKLDNGPAIGNN